MSKLIPISNTELSEYAINLLAKHGVNTVTDFVRESPERILKILNLNEGQFTEITASITSIYGGRKQSLTHQLQDWKAHGNVYKTGITTLDGILGYECLRSGVVWELCGLPGVGKTQMAFSILVNFVLNHNAEALYLDTKTDFSAVRIHQILKAKGCDMDKCVNVMEQIKVVHTLSFPELLQILHKLELALEEKHFDVTKLKLIIIDSIPAVWFLLKPDNATDRPVRKILLSQLDHILHKLAKKYSLAVIVINLSLNITNMSGKKQLMEEDIQDVNPQHDPQNNPLRPTLGIYWQTVPHVRLSVEYPQVNEANKDHTLRIIKVLKNCYNATKSCCEVHLIEQGIV